MRLMPFLIMLAVMSAAGSILFAAEPARPATEQTQPAAKAPDKTGDTKAPAKADDKSGPGKAAEHDVAAETTDSIDKTGDKPGDKPADKQGDKSPADKSSPQRFVPSEQVRADFDVSFPVDI